MAIKNQNIRNFDSIYFYSGVDCYDASTYTEGRLYGTYIESLGTLTKTADANSVWSKYKSVEYSEEKTEYKTLGDIYETTLGYVSKVDSTWPIGDISIKNNRYSAIYGYISDLDNYYDNGAPRATSDLHKFLIGLNTNIYNRQKYYSTYSEISKIKMGATTFTWYPADTTAYMIHHEEDRVGEYIEEGTYSYSLGAAVTYNYTAYSYYVLDSAHNIKRPTTYSYIVERPLEEGQTEGTYTYNTVNCYTYNFLYEWETPYKLGGNYYSYLRNTYATIDDALAENVKTGFDAFEQELEYNKDMYTYYLYKLDASVPMTLTSYSVGRKQSTFEIKLNSDYNQWYTYNIAIHANLGNTAEASAIATITSGVDGIYNIVRNENSNLTGNNTEIKAGETKTFTTSELVEDTDIISILTPSKIEKLDLSSIATNMTGILDIDASGWVENNGSLMSSLIIGNSTASECMLTAIKDVNKLSNLETINIAGCSNLTENVSVDMLGKLKNYNASKSNITSFVPKKGITLNEVILPNTIKHIVLDENKFANSLTIEGYDALEKLTINNVTSTATSSDAMTMEMVKNWCDAIGAKETEYDGIYYLELKGIDWSACPVDLLLNIEKLDNISIHGDIAIIGSGVGTKLTRTEYQSILKTFGLDAFNDPDMRLRLKKGKEMYEYSLGCTFNAPVVTTEEPLSEEELDKLEKPLPEKVMHVTINDNRPGNAFLDIIDRFEEGVVFTNDEINGFATFKLDAPLDTDDSEEITKIEVGDLLLYNGDTLVANYTQNAKNTLQFKKIGFISDYTWEDTDTAMNMSLLKEIFTRGYEFKFIPTTTSPEELTTEEPTEGDTTTVEPTEEATTTEGSTQAQ